MIHGLGNIVFKSGTTEITVEKVVKVKDEAISKELRSESELANEVSYFSFEDRHLLQFRYHLFKHGGNAALNKFREIWVYRNKKVKFKFKAGIYFLDTDGGEADYYLRINRTFWDTPDYKDVLILNFESLKPIDFAASALPEKTIFSHVQDNYYPNVDSQGNLMIYED